MQKVILDTNMLLVPGQFQVDVFSELDRIMEEPYEILILQGTLDELERIVDNGKSEDRRAAKLAKMLIEHNLKKDFPAAKNSQCKALKIIGGPSEQYVDDAIVQIAEDDALVATNDADLKRRLLEQGTRVIYLKQQQYLTMG